MKPLDLLITHKKNINLEIEDIPLGNYNLVINAYNNDQNSMIKRYQIDIK
ncbi:Uncharacterised protein [Yersinia pseudotuberculosis]|nr:Uncharacterised protein [Yersinia pseudotuberculosis]